MKKKGGSGYTPKSVAQVNSAAPNSPILTNSLILGANSPAEEGHLFLKNFNNKVTSLVKTHSGMKGGMKGGNINNVCGSNAPPAGTPKMVVPVPNSVIPKQLQGAHNVQTSVHSLVGTMRSGQIQSCGDKNIGKSGGNKSKQRRRRSKSNRKKRTKRTKRTKGRRRRSTKRTKGRKSRRRR